MIQALAKTFGGSRFRHRAVPAWGGRMLVAHPDMKTPDKPLNFSKGWNAALDAAAVIVGSREQLAGLRLELPAGIPGTLSWKVSKCCLTAEITADDSGYLILKAGDCVRAMFVSGSENTTMEDIPLPDNGSVEDAKKACETHRQAACQRIV